MKSKFLTTLLVTGFALVSCNTVMAADPGKMHEAAKNSLRTEISQQIACPAFVTTNSDDNNVAAIVQVTETGKIEVLEISTLNPELKNYVVAELSKIRVSYEQTGPFRLVIKFRAI